MKKFRILYLLSLIAAVFTSCSDESQSMDSVYEMPDLSLYEETFSQNIKYKGMTYRVLCGIRNDSLEYLDKTFNELYINEISQNENLAMLAVCSDNGEDLIEFYDTAAELEDAHNMEYFNTDSVGEIGSRALGTIVGRAILYDDKNYRDRSIVLDIDKDQFIAIPNLKNYAGFNDKTSSIRVFNFLQPNVMYTPQRLDGHVWSSTEPLTPMRGSQLRTCLINFENSNYGGKVLYCVADYSPDADINRPETATHQDNRLRSLGWNDKISSVVFRIVTLENIQNGSIIKH